MKVRTLIDPLHRQGRMSLPSSGSSPSRQMRHCLVSVSSVSSGIVFQFQSRKDIEKTELTSTSRYRGLTGGSRCSDWGRHELLPRSQALGIG